jgi:hypothetical protein
MTKYSARPPENGVPAPEPERSERLSLPPRNLPQPTMVAAGVGEYLHNSSLVNQITTTNRASVVFNIINDYTSNGSEANRPKQVSRLSPGAVTSESADTDVILPCNRGTRFVLPGGYITSPGTAVRTSGWGKVNISEVSGMPNVYQIDFKGGITPGGVSEIPNPIVNGGPFGHTPGIERLRETLR